MGWSLETRAPYSASGMQSPADYRGGDDSKLLPESRTFGEHSSGVSIYLNRPTHRGS
jgi:hypothetical protein